LRRAKDSRLASESGSKHTACWREMAPRRLVSRHTALRAEELGSPESRHIRRSQRCVHREPSTVSPLSRIIIFTPRALHANMHGISRFRRKRSVPSDLTIFAAKFLVFFEALLAIAIVARVLLPRPRTEWVRWSVLTGIALVLAYAFAQIGGAIYSD